MSTFQFNLTHKCNLNCPFCYSLQSKEVMNKTTIKNTIEFISHKIQTENSNDLQIVSFSGGEVFLGKYEEIPNIINQLKEENPNTNFKFILQSNLTIPDFTTNNYKNILEVVDEVGTSWDFKLRFKNNKQITQYWANIDYLQQLKKPIEIIVCITKPLLEYYPDPADLLDRFRELRLNHIELERLCRPIEDRPLFQEVKPLNIDVSEWLYKAYQAYKEIQKTQEFHIDTFDCIEDAINGDFHYEHGRNCQESSYTILPNGDVGQCILNVDKPFYNVNTKELNINNYDEIIQREKQVNPICLTCDYYKYCRGDCCAMNWDKSGCPTPKKIFDLILEGRK